MKKSLFQKLIILLFALPALACALTGEDEATPTPTDAAPTATAELSPTQAPTDIAPTPTLEVTVEPEPTVDVTADFVSYTSADTGITVQHPSDWVVQDFSILLIATDETIFDAPEAISEGAAVAFDAEAADEFDSTDPIDLVNETIEEFALSDDDTIVEGPTATTIQGQPAAIAKVEGTPTEIGIPLVSLAVVVVNGDRVGIGLGITPKASEADYIPTIEAMLNTIEVGQPAEESEITTSDPPTTAGSTLLSIGEGIASTLEENGQRDFYFEGRADETVTFTAVPMEDEIDLVMELFDADLNSLVRQDEQFSGESEVIIFTPPADGTYFIRVSDFYGFPGGINVSVAAGAVEPTETISETIPLETGQLTPGALTGQPLQYTFTGTAEQPTTIVLIPTEDWDPTLTVLGSDGTILVDEVDDGFPGDPEAVTFTPESDGEYILVVDGFVSAEGSYDLFVFNPETTITVEGSVPESGSQTYRICTPANASLIFVVLPADTFDPVVELSGPGGGLLMEQVDNGGIGDSEAVHFAEGASIDTEYAVIISILGYNGQAGDFTLFVTSTSPEAAVLSGC